LKRGEKGKRKLKFGKHACGFRLYLGGTCRPFDAGKGDGVRNWEGGGGGGGEKGDAAVAFIGGESAPIRRLGEGVPCNPRASKKEKRFLRVRKGTKELSAPWDGICRNRRRGGPVQGERSTARGGERPLFSPARSQLCALQGKRSGARIISVKDEKETEAFYSLSRSEL